MATRFDHQAFEKKWQDRWEASGIYKVETPSADAEKKFILTEFPYPSGNLHIGHWYAFAVPDIYVRTLRMQGKQVLYPVGFDSFGLPAENAAIKRKLDPKVWTYENIAYMQNQLKSMGNAYDWSRLVITSNPEYYRWTQWIFLELFKSDIAYRGVGIVNWCPSCNTVLANEQVVDGKCERSGDVVELREMPEWKLRITKYADRLTDDLTPLPWPEFIKDLQRNWIGRSEGAEIDFTLSTGDTLTVFTTRPDTLYGATFCVMAPEHKLLETLKPHITNGDEVVAYQKVASQKDEIERTDAGKEKTGVKLEGITATNPATGEQIPVFIADYILARYGTGAIMAVPAHDERDNAFAKKYGIKIRQVTATHFIKRNDTERIRQGVYGLISKNSKYLIQHFTKADFYWLPGGGLDEGETEVEGLIRELNEETSYSDFAVKQKISIAYVDTISSSTNEVIRNQSNVYLVELTSEEHSPASLTETEIQYEIESLWLTREAIQKLESKFEPERIQLILEAISAVEGTVKTSPGSLVNSGEFNGMDSEEAKDAIIAKVGGRKTSTYKLRDWSISRQRYWGVPIPIVYDPQGNAHAVPAEHLPWVLPTDVDVTPTGEPPLAKSVELKERTERLFGAGWTPEVETMDTFMCSSWYFMRYTDPQNETAFASHEMQKAWLPIDIYFGGSEHTTMHLLYSRFMQKALFDLGHTPVEEPYRIRINRGLVLGPDGNKMSKSKGNVIDPDEQVARLGADTVKMYLAFMGPYGTPQNYPWDMGGIAGLRRFLERVYDLHEKVRDDAPQETTKLLHKTIVKLTSDIENFKFNTAISALMVFINAAEKDGLTSADYTTFLRLLAPFAPHLTEELWEKIGITTSVHTEAWPVADPALLTEEEVTLGVQINGKMRETIVVPHNADESAVLAIAYAHEGVVKRLDGEEITKVIFVQNRVLNLIVTPKG
ncbi:MAG: leucyl-tRNA synthetase, leucyl-tRNA synthetase [Candidatus Parcubacteria bacterium]|jgi:leucyl-tRNA synthetase